MRRRLNILSLCLACLLVLPYALASPAAPAADPEPSHWAPQSVLTYGNGLTDVAAANALTSWVVGTQGSIVHTDDGGLTWTSQDAGTSVDLWAAACVGPSRCWAVGPWGNILHTSDGATWGPQVSNTTVGLTAVDFVDQSHGWAAGNGRGTSPPGVVHTTDGGLTWEAQALPASPPGVDGLWQLDGIDFVDSNNGWAVGGRPGVGMVLHTDNGGADWSVQDFTTAGEALADVFFLDANNGWAVGGGGVIHTDDGGATWRRQTTPIAADLQSVAFGGAGNGWVVGAGGEILHTIDGGASWTQTSATVTGIPSLMLWSVAFADAEHGWATGEYGVILRYDASDRTAPQVQSLSVSPSSVSVDLASADITFEARVTDDITGLAWSGVPGGPSQIQFRSPSGGETLQADFTRDENQVSGTALDGTYRFTMTVPQLAELGTWTVDWLRLIDNAGNMRQLSAADLSTAGFPTSFEVVPGTAVQLTASVKPAVVAYKGLVTVGGELRHGRGALLPGRALVLQTSPNGTSWSDFTSVDSLTGTYSTTTRIVRKTFFRWSFAGDATYPAAVSPKCSATCRASLTPLAVPSVVRIGVKYTSFGYLRPQHAGGRAPITISFYRYSSGRWRPMMGGTWSGWDNVSGATRYGIWYRLGTNDAGRWRVRAMHRDADHVKTYSAWRYFVVR